MFGDFSKIYLENSRFTKIKQGTGKTDY